jgi:GGDEF domain-containing protein
VRVTCSIGLATYPAEAIDSGEALVQVADQCLYSAKNGGRNQVRAL